ncbi:UDP-2-acetamido-3-amino-2,3-dideoxy-D-glucuronate N-acetyltransferase [Gracilariopsis chorda]|uniref:UDP-2-acetamido-3-amino-2, 3-dideoxy-D-glucuronate N-acetyltransferase n=1 Tax=Gracilariopsis chorda TaxID=448386 RepID=A0A2V3ISL8_9FLOR|nr:UDP-2-acetamido-3-amino-2,3-dideoxy-D-glucuronate N-acetyltransferase [Gracilariopsis chorda]|eukprot:PXF45113.1 UDP-2-acetamido-3-amino-2,3-dideoxy-D-glucuronate N-acetyltransferase [Gracilariopsis chorda]
MHRNANIATTLIIVGAGKWGTNFITTACALKLSVAIVETNLEALALIKCNPRVSPACRFFSNLGQALGALPNAAVVVATPPSTHFALAKQAITAGRHVLVEKPMCDNLQDAQRLADLARNHQVTLMVDHLLHYSVHHRRMLYLIESGLIGKVKRVHMSRMNFGAVRTNENVLWSLSPHDVSILLAVFKDQSPDSVLCTGHKVVSLHVEDSVSLHVRFKDGVHAQIDCNWMHPFKERRTIVYGTKGCIVLNEAMPDATLKRIQAFHWSAKRKHDGSSVKIEKSEAHILQYLKDQSGQAASELEEMDAKQPLQVVLEHFLECIQKQTVPRTDGNEGVRVLRILSAASESLVKGGEVVSLHNISPAVHALRSFVHPTAVVDQGAVLGQGTKVWHFSHIMPGAVLKEKCNIGQNVYIGGKAKLGRNVKVQNNVSIYDEVCIDDDVFLGPSCVLTNVKNPRSHVSRKHEYMPTVIEKGVTVGANATIVCGITLGAYSFVGAGAVVTKNVPPHAMVYGNPAVIKGWMSTTGNKLHEVSLLKEGRKLLRCRESQEIYRLYEKGAEVNGRWEEGPFVMLERSESR